MTSLLGQEACTSGSWVGPEATEGLSPAYGIRNHGDHKSGGLKDEESGDTALG